MAFGQNADGTAINRLPRELPPHHWHHPDAILDRWTSQDWQNGFQLDQLAELDALVVQTENTSYEVTVLEPSRGEILVRGGRFFPSWTPVRLAGCSLRGSFLKLRGVYVGYCLEFHENRRRIVTSRIRSIGQLG
jgi:hypothetical protein